MMVYPIEMTPEQHAFIVDLLKYEAEDYGGRFRPESSEDWASMEPGRKEISTLAHAIEVTNPIPRATEEQIALARKYHCEGDNEVQVDDDAVISDGGWADTTGYWVSAWLWIPSKED